jgi:hypothetical protein
MFSKVQSVVVILCRVYSNLHSCRAPRSQRGEGKGTAIRGQQCHWMGTRFREPHICMPRDKAYSYDNLFLIHIFIIKIILVYYGSIFCHHIVSCIFVAKS